MVLVNVNEVKISINYVHSSESSFSLEVMIFFMFEKAAAYEILGDTETLDCSTGSILSSTFFE